MLKPRVLVLFAVFSCLRMSAQTSTELEQPEIPLLRANTNLVILDVVVTDKSQEPVLNLKANDFRVMENGRQQVIRSFEEHTGMESAVAPAAPLPAGEFTNAGYPSNGSTLNIFLLDSVNESLQVQMNARQEMLKYLKSGKPSGPIAIFALGTQLKLIQGFTGDTERVTAVLTHYVPELSLINPNVGGGGRGRTLSAADSTDSSVTRMSGLGQRGMGEFKLPYTLNSLNALARYLAGIPGRKNLIWFTQNLPFDLAPYHGVASRYGAMYDDELQATVDLLAHSRVAVYPIDAAGITMNSGPVPQITKQEMASQTGGHIFPLSNDIAEIMAKSIAHGSRYYTIAYTPAGARSDNDYRSIRVTTDRPGLQLEYRQGYFAYADNRATPKGTKYDASAPPDSSTFSPMHMALLPGTPLPSQILFKARVLPVTADVEKSLAPGNVARNKLKGPFQTYAVDVKADPRGMMFLEGADGSLHDSIEFICFVYDAEGRLINTATGDVNARIKESVEQFAGKGGMVLHQKISVPVKGEYTLRIALHDMQGDGTGAVEVPISSVRGLAPAVASASIR